MTIIGKLACQSNSFLRNIETQVVSQTPCQDATNELPPDRRGLIGENQLYLVELEDTVLFPEGGGQPSDTGSLAFGEHSFDVIYVGRNGLKAVHYVTVPGDIPLKVGDNVTVSVNWVSRWDHMQQHTGQHLLSALLEIHFDVPTLGWGMGTGDTVLNYVEIPRKLEGFEIEQLNSQIKATINQNLPISVVEQDEIHEEKGSMRDIRIGHLDNNSCCGTHLQSSLQIKNVIALNQISGKKTNTRLQFIVGDRVNDFVSQSFNILKNLRNQLSCPDDLIPEKVSHLNSSLKASNTTEKKMLKELAEIKAQEIVGSPSKIIFVDSEFSNDFASNIFKLSSKAVKDKTVILLSGKSQGSLIIYGENVKETTDGISSILEKSVLKGGGSPSKYQGKIQFDKNERNKLVKYLETISSH
ncbi:BA75_01650T0 [Komagataella pastoris]|uniref:BA75_01650T0 n=1 Tax=Komagataella pastoris TaxID=4922 RepID=A0A1B2JA53_PICPA|nr:BA75_01650T0 [Komagataella pastoris]